MHRGRFPDPSGLSSTAILPETARRPWSCEPASRSSSRAVLAGRTFFRYFSDKREALFAGSDELRAVLVEKILQVPDVGEPLQVVIGALSEFDWENLGSRNSQRKRQAVIAANPKLLERDLIKNHSIAVGFIDALRQRGVTRISRDSLPTWGFNCLLRLTYIGLRQVPKQIWQ
jgi:hypothetical protein